MSDARGVQRNPKLVHEFTICAAPSSRRRANRGDLGVGSCRKNGTGRLLLVTQNVDDLHEKAIPRLSRGPVPANTGPPIAGYLHMHGELAKARCEESEKIFAWDEDIVVENALPLLR